MTGVSKFHERWGRPPASDPFVDAAIALGLPVFPARLVGSEKTPLTTHGHLDASSDPVKIRAMFAGKNANLVGMATGRISGLIGIDIDVKDGARGREWLDAHPELPPTQTHVTQSGGFHLIFKMPSVELRNSKSRIAPGVDVRAEGGWLAWPPSVGYRRVDDTEPAEMPDWLLRAALPPVVYSTVSRSEKVVEYPTEGGSPYGLAALNSECDAIRFAPDGTKHGAINKAAYSIGGLVAGGELDAGLARDRLRDALEAIRARCKNFKAAEKTLDRAFRDGQAKARDVAPLYEPPADEVHPAQPLLDKINRRHAKAQSQPLPVSADLMDVPGALGMFVDHCERTAISPQPFLALAAGICLIGTLAGRKYRTSTDLRTNIYAVGVADSGAGKDHARKRIKACLAEAGLTKYLGGEKIGSGQAMLTALSRHPAALFQIDEFGDFLADVLSPKASAHRRDIAANLKTLYSSASTFMGGTEYANAKDRPKEDIQQPHACLYAATTPGQLWAAIAGRSLHDGLMARVLLFVSPCSYPDEADAAHEPVPADLIQALKDIAAGPADPATGELGNLGNLMLATTWAEAVAAPNTPGAEAAYKALRKEQIARQRKHEGTYVTAIVGRLAENAMKLALVRAISRRPAMPEIGEADVAWGRALTLHCIDTLLREAENNVSETAFEASMKRALGFLRRHGPLTERDMIHKGWSLPSRERADILATLEAGGHIKRTEVPAGPKGGRSTVKFSLLQSTDTTLEPTSEQDD